jgi:hypothetical protein
MTFYSWLGYTANRECFTLIDIFEFSLSYSNHVHPQPADEGICIKRSLLPVEIPSLDVLKIVMRHILDLIS